MRLFTCCGRTMLIAAAVVGLGLTASGCGKRGAFTDDRDNQRYKTIKIWEQTWMAENLNYQTQNGSWCYENSADNCKKYGRLYDWNAATTACPAGWRLPSKDDWAVLVTGVGSEKGGKNLKSTFGWNNNGNGIDDYGFSALPGGRRDGEDDSFENAGDIGYWWTATEGGSDKAYFRGMGYYYDGVAENDLYKYHGHSVRCVKERKENP